jgi:molybdenum cofactor cytidylyltransferase
MILAVVPAAGHSVRMGRPKLSLPLGDHTVLEWVIRALRAGSVEHVLVVVGPQVRELAPLAESAGADVLTLHEDTPDMRATVQHGLDWLEKNYHPQHEDKWLLVPADHPTLDAGVVRQLLDARQEHLETSIVIPTYQGKRGHPAIITWKHIAGIRALPPGSGLNAYLREHAGDTLELPVASPHVLCDLDTPEDYERLCSAVKNSGGDSFLV